MILSDREIDSALANGFIRIHPIPPREHWTSTAIDLTLHKTLLMWTPKAQKTGTKLQLRPHGPGEFNIKELMDDPNWATRIDIPAEGYELEKNAFVLGYTREAIYLPNRSRLAARVEGKSSLARLGVGVHVTAPTIHAGFGYKEGVPEKKLGSPIQLEIFNLSGLPVVLDEGMPICQLILEEVRELPTKGYKGQFSDQAAFAAPPHKPSDSRSRGHKK
jgi:dCTP deaminase